MSQTHFTSPVGLPYPTETSTYSTPSDLLTLGLAAKLGSSATGPAAGTQDAARMLNWGFGLHRCA